MQQRSEQLLSAIEKIECQELRFGGRSGVLYWVVRAGLPEKVRAEHRGAGAKDLRAGRAL